MKKILIVLSLILVVSASSLAFAQSSTEPERTTCPYYNPLTEEQRVELFKQRMEERKATIEKDLADGNITEDEAKLWLEHFNSMEKWHEENGFYPGGCQGKFGFQNGGRRRQGNGMRRGFGLNNSSK